MATAFGDRLRQAREHSGMNQSQVALAVGIRQPSLSAAENAGLGSKHVHRYAEAYGVNPHWLATGEGEMLAIPGEMTGRATMTKATSQARELAALFDLIPESNRIGRAVAYTKASQAILDQLQPATAPAPAGSEKLTA